MGRWYRRQPVAWRRLGYPRLRRWTACWGPPARRLLGHTQPQPRQPWVSGWALGSHRRAPRSSESPCTGRGGAARPAPALATPGMGLGMGGAACRVSASAPSKTRPHTGHALWRLPVERLLLLGLAPWLLGLGIQVRHHWTFLAGLAFTLIRLAACGFHGAPSLPAAAAHAQASGSIAVIVLHI
jgi:hypothetical protein